MISWASFPKINGAEIENLTLKKLSPGQLNSPKRRLAQETGGLALTPGSVPVNSDSEFCIALVSHLVVLTISIHIW